MISFTEYLFEEAGVPQSKLEQQIKKLEADIEKRNQKLEEMILNKESSIQKELAKERKNAEKQLKTVYNGVYTDETRKAEEASRGYFNWTIGRGLDSTGKFSWTVWEQKTYNSLSSDRDFWINDLKETIYKKEREIAKLEERFEKEMEKETKKAAKVNFMRTWMKIFTAPEKLKLLLKYIEDSYIDLLRKEDTNGIYTEEKLQKKAKLYTDFLMIDLSHRISDITGKLTDCEFIKLEFSNMKPVITGYFIGETANAESRVIIAGGYNIQKLHNRVIVTKR